MKKTNFEIFNPLEVKKGFKLDIESIALKDNTYYIKSKDNEYYSLTKDKLREMCLFDRTGICAKAFRDLKNNQVITNENIIDIDDIKIITKELTEQEKLMRKGIFIPKEYYEKPKAKDINLTLEDIENRKIDIDKSMFDEYTFADMYKYIVGAETKYMFLYDIASRKFDQEYNTEDKQRVFFERLSLKSHADFEHMYINKSHTVHEVQEEIWRKKTKDIWIDEEEISKKMYSVDKLISNVYVQALYDSKLISQKAYEVLSNINRIIYILASVNLKGIYFDDVYEEIVHINRLTKNKPPRILRLSIDEIKEYVNEYHRLQQELNEIYSLN